MKKEDLNSIKKAGFKIPDGYFDTFEAQLKAHIKIDEASSDIQSSGFTVPQDYFNTIEDTIINKTSELDKATPVIKLNHRRSLYYISGIAASLLLLIAIFITKEEPSELSIEMVETYFETQDINSYELAELLIDAELIDEDFTITDNTYDETNLETYLLDNADIDVFLE